MSYINQKQAAELLGVSPTHLSDAMPYLHDFPAAQRFGKSREYLASDIEAYGAAHDVPALVRAAATLKRRGESANNARCAALAHSFLTGKLDAPSRRRQHAARIQTARQNGASIRYRVTVAGDW